MIDDQIIRKLKQTGFVNMGNSILNEEETQELCDLSKNVYTNMEESHPDRIKIHEGGEGVRRLPQHNKQIARILDKIFSAEAVKKALSEVMGTEYKIWGIHLRRSYVGEPGLYLHQDGVGQVSIAITLDDNPKGDGATIFVPSSHLIQTSLKKMNMELTDKLLSFLKFLFTPLAGNKGDVSLFVNRTWHGRFPNNTSTDHDVILIGMFPANVKYGYENWNNEFLKSIEGTELFKLLEYPVEPVIQTDRDYLNDALMDNDIFSFDIETKSPQYRVKRKMSTRITVLFIKIVMVTKKLLVPVVRLKRAIRH